MRTDPTPRRARWSRPLALALLSATLGLAAAGQEPKERDEPLSATQTLAMLMSHVRATFDAEFSYRTCERCPEPIVVEGRQALEAVHLEEQPLDAEVRELLTGLLRRKDSRAVLQRGVPARDGTVSVVVVPFPADLEKPRSLSGITGMVLDDAFAGDGRAAECPNEERVSCGFGHHPGDYSWCRCFRSRCCEPRECAPCPEKPDDDSFPYLGLDPDLRREFELDPRLVNPVPIDELAIGESLFRG